MRFNKNFKRNFKMKAAFLPDRGVVKVFGEDARDFLNGLVTTDVTRLGPGRPFDQRTDEAAI